MRAPASRYHYGSSSASSLPAARLLRAYLRRIFPAFGVFLCLFALTPGIALSQSPTKKIDFSAPIRDFSLPLFSKEGFRTLLLLGGEARFEGDDRILVKNMQLTLFTGDPSDKVETIIISAAATFMPNRYWAEGSEGVRIIRDDSEMSGDRWSYDHKQKKVVLDGRVRVIFRAQLDAILK